MGEIVRDLEMDMDTWLYLKWITSKVVLYDTGYLLHVMWQAGGMGGEFGENGYMDMY